MSNIIIFEGVDNCGKTTIATELARKLKGYQYFKIKQDRLYVEKIDPEVLKQSHLLQMNFFHELARQVDFKIIMDRFYPSEYVYGSLFRTIDQKKLWEFDGLFARLGAKIIILQKKDEGLEDEIWSKEQLIAIRNKFAEFADWTECEVLLLDTDSEDLDSQLEQIIKFVFPLGIV